MSFLDAFEVAGWSDFVIPGSCLSGGFRGRLVIDALAPFMLMVALLVAGKAVGIAKHLLGGCKQQPSPVQRLSSRLSSERSSASSLQTMKMRMWFKRRLLKDWHNALPMLLFVIFCVTPTTSTNILAAWSCETFQVDGRVDPPSHVQYLRRDLSVLCEDSDTEYSSIVSLATVFVVLWPIGAPLLFLALLLSCRPALLRGQSTRHVRSTAVLHREFHKEYWWWELVFTLQRLVIVGFIQWIEHLTVRLFFGLIISLVFLVGLLLAKPYKRTDVGILAYFSQVSLVVVFLMLLCIRLFSSLEDVDVIELSARVLGFESVDTLVASTICITFGVIAFFVGFTLYQAFAGQHQDLQLLRIVASGQPPEMTLGTGMAYNLVRAGFRDDAHSAPQCRALTFGVLLAVFEPYLVKRPG